MKKSAGVRFKARGPHKCVQKNGRSQQGLHAALCAALSPSFNYEACKKAKTLTTRSVPPGSTFVACHEETRKTWPGSAAALGRKLDAQLTATVRVFVAWRVPRAAFFDPAARKAFVRDRWPPVPRRAIVTPERAAAAKEKRGFLALCARLMPEARMAWRVFVRLDLAPFETQTAVALRGVGTRVDVVARDADGAVRVIEVKRGCAVAFGNGAHMRAPFAARFVSTHDHYVLQSMVSHELYRASAQQPVHMGLPMLMRFDRAGAHVYLPPVWAAAGFRELMALLARA